MFDDYKFKSTDTRVLMQFSQQREEPLYPWEIAGFLAKLNTVYYKFELLNSISSAIEHGIDPEGIFVLDKSLPLYRRYSSMNLLDEAFAAKRLYPIGLPYPLVATKESYEFHFFFRAFGAINAFLHKEHVRPMSTDTVAEGYEILRSEGLDAAESFIVGEAYSRSQKSVEAARNRDIQKEQLQESAFFDVLKKSERQRDRLLSDVSILQRMDETQKIELFEATSSTARRLQQTAGRFFWYFERTTRPLVLARVAPGKFRVLGRSLVSKKEQTGLELKYIQRNSPFKTLVEAGIALYQVAQGEGRTNELHKYDVEKKKVELEIKQEELVSAKLRNTALRLDVVQRLEELQRQTDLSSRERLKESLVRLQLDNAYVQENRSAKSLMTDYGLYLDGPSVRIDERA